MDSARMRSRSLPYEIQKSLDGGRVLRGAVDEGADRETAKIESAGFTMMEILVVLSIITIVLALLSPTLFRLAGRGQVTETQALVLGVKTALQAYAASPKYGTFPPTLVDESFLDLANASRFKPNNTNVGIESLVFHLTLSEFEGESPFGDEERFVNLDDDEGPVAMTWMGTPELLEYTDSWGNPLIYFNLGDLDPKGDLRFDVTTGEGEILTVRPQKSSRFKGVFAGRNDGFQIISLGPDGEFGTSDDIVSWNVSGGGDEEEEDGDQHAQS